MRLRILYAKSYIILNIQAFFIRFNISLSLYRILKYK